MSISPLSAVPSALVADFDRAAGTRALDDCGVKAVTIGTGRTGLIQGAHHAV